MEDLVQKAINAYISLKASLGTKPSSREFFKVFPKSQLYQVFEGGNAYSRLQELAGDSPNKFSSSKSDLSDILIKWGELAQKTLKQYGKLPVMSDWKINKLKPSVSGIDKSHNIKWSDIPYLFQNEFSDVKKWEEELKAIPKFNNKKIGVNKKKELHETYKHKRKRGEWFNLDEEDIKEITVTLNDYNG